MMLRFLIPAMTVFSLSAPSLARGPEHGKQGRWKEVMEKLDLSEEQSQKIRDIRKSSKEERQQTRKQIKEAHDKFDDLLANDGSEGDIRSAFENLQSLKSQMAKKRFENMLAIRGVLNAEQRKTFHQLRPKHKRKGLD